MPIANHLDEKRFLTGAQRMAHVDLRRLVGAAVLVEEAELRDDGADERQQDAQVQHGFRKIDGTAERGDGTTGVPDGPLAKPVPLSIGPQGPRLEGHSD